MDAPQPAMFRKRPVEVAAIQWTGTDANFDAIYEFTKTSFRRGHGREAGPAVYDALHDTWVKVNLNDWIIRGVQQEFYPCRDDVFVETYERSGPDPS